MPPRRSAGGAAKTGGAMEGGCICGDIRYRLTDRPLVTHCCHCTWCQRQSGSAFVLNLWIETARVDLTKGAPVETDCPTPSGGPYRIAQCPACRTTLWGTFGAPVFRFVRAGTLDAAGQVAPDVHIYTASKVPWLALGDDVPVFEGYYRRTEVWRSDALARFETAKAGLG